MTYIEKYYVFIGGKDDKFCFYLDLREKGVCENFSFIFELELDVSWFLDGYKAKSEIVTVISVTQMFLTWDILACKTISILNSFAYEFLFFDHFFCHRINLS